MGGSYPSAEKQSVYFTAPANWAIHRVKCQTVLIQPIQFSISIDFVYIQSNVKTVLYQTIQFRVCTVSMSKTVSFQTIHFSIRTQFK